MASKNHLWVVAGLSERVGDVAYNTVALINRQHNLACTYREVHLSREEWKEGVRPGDECPVFDTGFGCVGMQTCCDGFFPQSTAIPPGKGAEVIVASTWGDTLPDADGKVSGETVFRARARDNGVYLASGVYDGNSLVIDPMDRILALDAGKTGVFWAEVDLSKRSATGGPSARETACLRAHGRPPDEPGGEELCPVVLAIHFARVTGSLVRRRRSVCGTPRCGSTGSP